MEEFLYQENLALLKKRLTEPHTDAERDVLLKLLAEEQAKEFSTKNGILEIRPLGQHQSPVSDDIVQPRPGSLHPKL